MAATATAAVSTPIGGNARRVAVDRIRKTTTIMPASTSVTVEPLAGTK